MSNRRQRAEALPVIVYTVPEAAALMKVSKATAYRIIRDGDLRFVKARGHMRVPVEAVEEWRAKAS